MKRTSIFYFSLAAITAGSLASCQDFDNGYDADQIREATAEKVYSENFKKYFGDYAVDHNWGFGAIPGGESTTRANVNEKNLWEELYHLSVPGWPDIYEKNGSLVNGGYHQATTQNKDDQWSSSKPSYTDHVPAGDVTDEEIQYVSWWFRTHPHIESEIVHWSDFYVQEISADVDRYLTGENAGKPNNVLYEHKQDNGEWKDVKSSTTVEFGLSKLHVLALGSNPSPGNMSGDNLKHLGYEHLEKYNGNTQNKLHGNNTLYVGAENSNIYENIGTTDYRVCGFYTSSGTEDFACLNTNDNTWNNLWVIRHLHFTGPSGRVYDGWYLGFDYEFLKVEGTGQNYPKPSGNVQYQYHDRDYIYSNWILKLTPAMPVEYPKPSGFTRRVMCEDLGNTFDYDFNDVVFDVTYNLTQAQRDAYTEGSNVDVTITIRAAGGTLPIYVGKLPSNTIFEAHNMLGSNGATNYPINVGNINNGKTGAIGVYHITVNSLDPDDIPIYVKTSGNIAGIAGDKGENNTHKVQEVKYTSLNQIAPQKFACPNTVQWMKELEFIDTGYPHFRDWAKAPNGTYAEYGSDGKTSANAWFKVGVDAAHQEHIYEYQFVSEVVDPVLPPTPTPTGTPFTVSSSEVTVATELEVGHSPLDLSTYIKSDLRSNTSAYSATITANDNDNTISLSGMVVSPQNAGTARVTITYNDATYSNKTLVVPFIVKAATKVSPFKSTAPKTVTDLNIGSDFNLQTFVLDDALDGISITKVSGADVLNLETKKIASEGTEIIRLSYTGDSFSEESMDVTITVGSNLPPSGDAITFVNPTIETTFIGNGKLTVGTTYKFEVQIKDGYTSFSNGSSSYSINWGSPNMGEYTDGVWIFTAEVSADFKISSIQGSTITSIKATLVTNNN